MSPSGCRTFANPHKLAAESGEFFAMRGSLETSSLDVLSSALDLARVGLALWDADDRLIAFNRTYVSLVYPSQPHEVRLGRVFVELARAFYGVSSNIPAGKTTE